MFGGAEDRPPKLLDCSIIYAPVGWMVPLALEKIRPGGTLAINAIHMTPIPEMNYELLYQEKTMRSVANATRKDGEELLQLAQKIPIKSTVNMYNIREANDALEKIKKSTINGEAVLRL